MGLLFGGIEAGGTKFVCAVGGPGGEVERRTVVPTGRPEETLPRVVDFFRSVHRSSPLAALGLASFGPVDLDPGSDRYGRITTPPKPGWADFDIVGSLRGALDVPVGFDTDVNGAALGEHRWGAARGLDSFLYVTVGTGIGAGGMAGGRLMHGLTHPEMGHMRLPQDSSLDPFAGVCPFHGGCLEGLASGPAIEKRWGVRRATDLPADHPAWDLEARYLGLAFANCVLLLSPQRIILGGGVLGNKTLYAKVRARMLQALNGYVRHDGILKGADGYLVEPGLGGESGIRGALALAEQGLLEAGRSTGRRAS
jgi:fructokinase